MVLRVAGLANFSPRDLHLNRAGFQVLRSTAGSGFAIFVLGSRVFHSKFLLCRVFEVIQAM